MSPKNGPDPWPSELRVQENGTLLKVTFEDGVVGTVSSERLRDASPSADKTRVRAAGGRPVAIVAIEQVGNYAVRIGFNDGHDTGIYYVAAAADADDALRSPRRLHSAGAVSSAGRAAQASGALRFAPSPAPSAAPTRWQDGDAEQRNRERPRDRAGVRVRSQHGEVKPAEQRHAHRRAHLQRRIDEAADEPGMAGIDAFDNHAEQRRDRHAHAEADHRQRDAERRQHAAYGPPASSATSADSAIRPLADEMSPTEGASAAGARADRRAERRTRQEARRRRAAIARPAASALTPSPACR